MLTERYAGDLPRLLLPRGRYRPFPTADDREPWQALPDDLRNAAVRAAEEHLGQPWPALPATIFMEFRRTGDRGRYEGLQFRRRAALGALVVAECMEGQGRFIDEIINGVWGICEESFWGVPAHNAAARFPGAALPDTAERIIDLFAGETGGLLAWTHYLLAARLDAVSPIVADRIRREVKERILDPYLARDDFWWMGLDSETMPGPLRRVNNWNPWCNSNCLAAALLVEEDPGRRLAAVDKALRSLDRFIESYPPDGGCDEGTSYWSRAGGSLFDCLELLHGATDGGIDIYGEPLIGDMGRYLYRAFISGDYFVNFADGGARVSIAADLVYRYGRRIGDAALMALGSSAFHRRAEEGRAVAADSLLRALPALFDYGELKAATAEPPYIRDSWLPDLQVMTARERGGSDRGLYVAAKGGHNGESHNHNDVGQFIVYADGRPVLIDAGVGTYTAQTFSPQRYEIWTMQSAYHNLPTVNGIQQQAGPQFAASRAEYEADAGHARLSVEIAGAYPPEAGIRSWNRAVRLDRETAPSVTVEERFELEKSSSVVLTLMTPCEPDLGRAGEIRLPGDTPALIRYPGDVLQAACERLDTTDGRLRSVWGDHLSRILLSSRAPVSKGDWTLQVEL